MVYFSREHFDYCPKTHIFKELQINWDMGKCIYRNSAADLLSASYRGPTGNEKYSSNSPVSYLPETPVSFYELRIFNILPVFSY